MDLERLSALSDSVLDVAKGEDLRTSLKRLVENAVRITDCTYGALGAISADGKLEEFTWVGMSEETADEIVSFPEGHGLLGYLLSHPSPLRLKNIKDHSASSGFPTGHPAMNAFLGIPIRIRDEIYGSLYLTEKKNGLEFTEEDESLVTVLASAAGVAIDNYRGHIAQEQVGVLAERERIARDLHDLVIQRLFATGLSLQALSKESELSESQQMKMIEIIDNLDVTVQQIRNTIFSLKENLPLHNLRKRVLEEVATTRAVSKLTITCEFNGALDLHLNFEVSNNLVAVVRELLSNVVRHANAKNVEITISANRAACEIKVRDDGVGYVGSDRMSGLRNLKQRAADHGGEFVILKTGKSGTLATWTVPL